MNSKNASNRRLGWPRFIADADVLSVLSELGTGARYEDIIAGISDRARANANLAKVELKTDPESAAKRAYKRVRPAGGKG